MGYLDNFFENKARKRPSEKIVSKDSISRAVAGVNNSWSGFGNLNNNWDIDRAVNKAYERVIWVFRCVDAIASAQASIPMYLKEYDTEAGHKVEDPVLNKLLNRKTNKFEDSWQFRYRLSSQLLLSTKGAFVELVRSGSGDVVEMYLLDPGTVEPVKDDQRYVKKFRVKRANGGVDELDPDQVIWLKIKAHPLDVYAQISPIVPSALSIETDYLARIFNRNFLKNDGRPGLLIGVDGDLSSEDGEEIKALFSGGYATAGQTRVIESQNIHVVDLSSKPRDVQWDDAIKNAKDEILLAFGVPESVLGNSSGRCLRASESVFLASGEVKSAEELVGQTFQLVQPTRDGLRVVGATAEYAKHEPIFKITTFSGRTLEANKEHPLFMAASVNKGPFKRDIFPWGWTQMENIKKHFDKNDRHGNDIFTEVAVPITFDQQAQEDFDADEAFEIGSEGKNLPDVLFTANTEAQQAFVSGLYSEHGLFSQHTAFDIYVPSRDYAIKLQRLLLRLGVSASINTKKFKHLVSIGGKMNMFTFLSQLELTGKNQEKAQNVWERLSAETSREHNAFRTDGLHPGLIWDRVYSIEEFGSDQTVAITILEDPNTEKCYLSLFWEHNTYNNADSEEETFWTKTMIPHCDSIGRALEPLTNDDNDEKYIAFDYDTVDVLQRIKRRKEDEVKQDFARGIITLNQTLVAMGLPEIDSAYGRVYFHPSRIIGGVDMKDVQEAAALPVIGATGQPGPGMYNANPFMNATAGGGDGQVGQVNDLVQGQLAANGTDIAAQTVNNQAARSMRSGSTTGVGNGAANPNAIVEVRDRINNLLAKKELPKYEVKQIDTNNDPHRELRLQLQGFIEGHLDSWSNRQLEVTKERVNHVKVRKGTRHWDGEGVGTKSLDTTYVVDVDEWTKEAYDGIYQKTKELIANDAVKTLNSLKDSGYSPDLTDLEVTRLVEQSIGQIKEASHNQSELVSKHIGVLDASGKSIQEIQDTLVKDTFDRSRWSVNLAKMVTTNVIESLYDAIYSKIDGNAFKIWCSGANEHYREGHGALHGTKIAVHTSFDINGEEIRYPAENLTDEAIGCTCWLYYGIDE